MKRKTRRMRSRRRLLAMEHLDARRVLATLNLMASDGVATEEDGTTVVTLDGGSAATITAVVDSSESDVQGFQLNFANSDSGLVISNFVLAGDFPIAADSTLDSSLNDYFVASAVLGELTVPSTRTFGTFDVTIPTAPGDYRLTSNATGGGELNNTILSTIDGDSIPITDFGDIVFRVEGATVPTVDLSPGAVSQNEGAGTVSITATLSEASDVDVTVPFVVSGSATVTDDFTVGASPITIAAGQLTGTVEIAIVNDAVEELDETVVVTLQAPNGADLGTVVESTLTILDDDAPVLGTDASLDLVPSSGTVRSENGITVVTVVAGTTVNVTGQITNSDQEVQTYRLDLGGSDAALTLNHFVVGTDFPSVVDESLDSTVSDRFVSSGLSGSLAVPPIRSIGSFDVTVPDAAGDYRLTATSATTMTAVLNSVGEAMTITDFGDVIFRVAVPSVSIAPESISRDESAGTVSMTVTLSEASASEVVIPFGLTGSAVVDADYTISASPIRIPAGETTASVTIGIIDDAVQESDESVIVTLQTPTGAVLGTTSESTLTIQDNDAPVTTNATLNFVPTSGAVSEENGVTVVTVDAGTTVIVSAEVGSADNPVQGYQLNFSSSDAGLEFNRFATSSLFPVATDEMLDSAANDFFVSSALIGELAVPPTRVLGTFDVTVPAAAGDYRMTADFVAGSETENTILSDSSSNALTITNFGDLVFRVQAAVLPTVSLSPSSQTANESDGMVTLTATLDAPAASDLQIPFSIGGTATENADYTLAASPLTIAAGQTTGSITVTLIDDTVVEPADETVVVQLQSGSEYQLGTSTMSTVTIVDNEITLPVEPTVGVVTAAQTATENAGTVTFDVQLSAPSAMEVTVPLTVSGTATEGSDFSLAPTSITIPANATSATVSISITDDTEVESAESVIVTLGAPINATLTAADTHTLTITDNDDDGGGGGRPTRIYVPDIIPKPYLIPGDMIPTAIMFGALADTTVSVVPVGTTSLEETIVILDGQLNQVSTFRDGVTTANIPGGSLYAVIFEPHSEDRVYSLRAINGEQTLTRATPTNLFMPTDTNGDGETTPLDALLVINRMSRAAAEAEQASAVNEFHDVNGDGSVTPMDALRVINYLSENAVSESTSDFLTAESEPEEAKLTVAEMSIDLLVKSAKFVAELVEPVGGDGSLAETRASDDAADEALVATDNHLLSLLD